MPRRRHAGRTVAARRSPCPTRTMVAPSSIAASKSPLIPIDSSAQPEPLGEAHGARRTRAAGPPPAGATVISPSTSSPSGPERVDERARVVGTRSRPSAPRRPRFTSTSTRAPGRPARDRRRRARRRSTECHQRTHGASWSTLLRWSRPMKCHVGAGSRRRARAPWPRSSWARFSPRSVRPARAPRATRVDRHASSSRRRAAPSPGSRPARARPRRRSRSRTSATRRRDVASRVAHGCSHRRTTTPGGR